MLIINTTTQTLERQGKTYAISSAENGLGEQEGSFCTPTGKFIIAAKIGEELPIGSVLVGRVPTGEIYSNELGERHPELDWILSRILWLDGVESHNKNTKARYIYIHGTPDNKVIGVANSKGCIRMKNDDIINLFSEVKIGDEVIIQ